MLAAQQRPFGHEKIMINFETEDDFQALLVKDNAFELLFPKNLYSKKISWLFVGREIWTSYGNVDLVFLDQDAVPYLIECKLKKNPDCKGKILTQLIEYAAHSKLSWNKQFLWKNAGCHVGFNDEKLTKSFESLNSKIENLDAFFSHAERNLRIGKIRLVLLLEKVEHKRLLITLKFLSDIFLKSSETNFLLFQLNKSREQINVVDFSNDNTLKNLEFEQRPDFQRIFIQSLENIHQYETFLKIKEIFRKHILTAKFNNKDYVKFLYRNRVVVYVGIDKTTIYIEFYDPPFTNKRLLVNSIDSLKGNLRQLQINIEMKINHIVNN